MWTRYPAWTVYVLGGFTFFVVVSPQRYNPLAWGAMALLIVVPAMVFWMVTRIIGWTFAVLLTAIVVVSRAVKYVLLG